VACQIIIKSYTVKSNALIKRSTLIFLLCVAFFSSSAETASDSIRHLTKVNKEFLVVVHIITNRDSLEGISESAIENAINSTNAIFEPVGMSFKVCEFRRIYNFQYNRLIKAPQQYDKELTAKYNVAKRINMYYIDTIVSGKDDKSICGFATLGGIGIVDYTDGVFIKKGCNDPGTIAHEFGHYFSLLHTFETGFGNELADGSNCSTAGDLLCDTPADPYDESGIDNFVNGSCSFISELKDANNAYYDPDVSNIMGYYIPCHCLKFTRDQYEKMAQYYLTHLKAW
jgi:hypothetical protein